MRCFTVFAIYMWLLVVFRSIDYWLCVPPRVTPLALVEVKVCLGIPSCGTRWVPRESRGLIVGSTGRGRPILGSTGRGRLLLYPASVFPTMEELENFSNCKKLGIKSEIALAVLSLFPTKVDMCGYKITINKMDKSLKYDKYGGYTHFGFISKLQTAHYNV